MAALYSNEYYPLGVVEHLREHGHDVLTTRDAGDTGRGIPDEDVLAFATAGFIAWDQGRAMAKGAGGRE